MSESRCRGDIYGRNKGYSCDLRQGECIFCDAECPRCTGGFVDDGDGGTALCSACGFKPTLQREIRLVRPPDFVVPGKVFLDHAKSSTTRLGEDVRGYEVQPVANMRPITPDDRVSDTHIILLPNASTLKLLWHQVYKWPGGDVYTASKGMDIVSVVMDRDGSMFAVPSYNYV